MACRGKNGCKTPPIASVASQSRMKALALPLFDEVEIGRTLGHDLFRFSRTFEKTDAQHSITEGFLQAQAQKKRQQAADRFTRKWLQLRLNAYARHRYVDEKVTPEFIRAIDVAQCPVMRVTLTHGELAGTDWSIDRLNNDGAYAPSNLAVISTTANQAKGNRSFEQVYALSQHSGLVDGLTSGQWLRLAALMLGPCFATKPSAAPIIALVTPIPKYTVRPVMQQVQYAFTTLARQAAGKNALIKAFDASSANELSQTRLRFLAEAVHKGLKGLEYPWDVWLKPEVMKSLFGWRECLNDPAWGMAGEIARHLTGGQRVNPHRMDAWRLGSQGYVSSRD